MNKKIYRQADSRWGALPYPTKAYSFAGNGCGCCAVLHCAIEQEKYKDLTPADARKYMVQYATKGNGTLWSGITKGLEHYGYTVHWRQSDSMSDIFKVLKNSLKRGVILFGSDLGPDGTCWTTSGHYIAFVDYRIRDGRHEFYLKDSGGRCHDGWYSYEKSMRGDVRNVWICTGLKDGEKKEDKKEDPKTTSEKVIDVSYCQPHINWKKVKADGVKGVIVRCGFRGYESGKLQQDDYFMDHIQGASGVGLKVGVYFFTEAINAKEGREEAEYTLKLVKKAGVKLSYPIAIDTEDINASNPTPRANSSVLSKANRTKAVMAFCEYIKSQGYEPMIYASTSWLNNQLDMSQLPYKVWCAQYYKDCQYKGKYVMWQYSSTGSVDGISGNCDMNHWYGGSAPAPDLPTTKLVKSNKQVKTDTIRWAVWIAGDKRFHYGYGQHAHHNGCYFCGTQRLKRGHGIVDPEFTYCCNPFVGAAWAHGGCVPLALSKCQKCNSWDFHTGTGYDKSKLFDNLGHPAKKDLQPGDVLCRDTHVALYIGKGQIAEASGGDDNKRGSVKWDNSIHVKTLTDANYKNFPRVHRFNGSVNATMIIRHGEVSERVAQIQEFLDWYYDGKFFKECGPADGIYGDNTLKWVKKFQAEKFGVKEADGLVGEKTLAAMAAATK